MNSVDWLVHSCILNDAVDVQTLMTSAWKPSPLIISDPTEQCDCNGIIKINFNFLIYANFLELFETAICFTLTANQSTINGSY